MHWNHPLQNAPISSELSVGEIVTHNYKTAEVFRKYGIDFCCGGDIPLQKACDQKKVPLDDVLSDLNQLDNLGHTNDNNYQDWSLPFLMDYIVQNHHSFVRRKVQEITAYAEKVARVHGMNHPENVDIFHVFMGFGHDLLNHLDAEESYVFPLIRNVYHQHQAQEPLSQVAKEQLSAELHTLESEHNSAGETLSKLRTLSNHFTPPEAACTTYRVLYQNLEGFEENMHKHIHLENNILFKKAKLFLD